jgi:hypothetical protein
MRQFLRNILLGVGTSFAYGVSAVLLERFWSVPLAVYLVPASVVDHPVGAHVYSIARRILPEGGASGAFLVVMGTAFTAWAIVFAFAFFVFRRRRVAVF